MMTSAKTTILSWNINSLRLRLPLLEKIMEEHEPTLILLQETKTQDKDFPVDFFHNQNYNVAFWGQKSYNGVAIASRWPLEDIQKKSFTDAAEEARYMEAFSHNVRVASVYVPNGQTLHSPAYEKKHDFFQHLRTHVLPFVDAEERVVLGGDFNVALSDADVAHPEQWQNSILFSLPERQWMRHMLHDGWTDSMGTSIPQEYKKGSGKNSGKNLYTWWDYRQQKWEKNDGLRIDYFLLSPRAADTLHDVEVLYSWRAAPSPSDHAPLLLTLK